MYIYLTTSHVKNPPIIDGLACIIITRLTSVKQIHTKVVYWVDPFKIRNVPQLSMLLHDLFVRIIFFQNIIPNSVNKRIIIFIKKIHF